MELAIQQQEAYDLIQEWLNNPTASQIFRLFGFAGTGKTTIAQQCVENVKGDVQFACFTGKAALVLRQKGCSNATTLHSLLYKPEEIIEKDPITGKETARVEFVFDWDSPLAEAALLVVDEVSMVGEELARDLMRHGTKILVLGDPAQLPPVKGEGFFINAEPDYLLTDIHRQAADNPIINMSMKARNGHYIETGEYGNGCSVIDRYTVDKDYMGQIVEQCDQVLCGMNRTRVALNNRIRQIKGFEGRMPVKGERLVCLRNNREKGLLNGGLWDVVDEPKFTNSAEEFLAFTVRSADGLNSEVEVQVHKAFFEGTEKDLDYWVRKNSDEFTFGYALTVHKSQGSQWEHVVVFDESGIFRDAKDKHLYTAITRAAERLTIVR